ncbi:MAG: AmmeMemoRadiSam system protein B [Desulfobacterales bacterium]|nr:AmmeMemoRadiSam system protein B [Desulfobacterales bacterium]
MSRKRANFSGSWYPSAADECEREIENFLRERQEEPLPDETYTGGVVPHAGWFFSGAIACNVIQRLTRGPAPDLIVIFGMHLHPGATPCIMTRGAWETPFGDLAVDEEFAGALKERSPSFDEGPAAFGQDNTIELQLPFIKYFFKDVKIVTVGAPPRQTSIEIGEAAADISRDQDKRIRVIGSTDLTHYGSNYGFSPKGAGPAALDWVRNENDGAVIDAMIAMDPARVVDEALSHQNACCGGAAAAALAAGKRLGARTARKLAYATSHDKHPSSSFVGYVGLLF